MTGFASTPEDRAILDALRLERESQESKVVETSRVYMQQLDSMALQETATSQLATIALDYQAEREQLPLAQDSKKIRKQKMLRRAGWTAMSGIFSSEGARRYSRDDMEDGELLIFHRDDQVEDPPLLFAPETDVYSGLQQGWIVGYPEDMQRRKSPTTIEQWQIYPWHRSVHLEVGFAVRSAASQKTLSYSALYQIIASCNANEPAKLTVTKHNTPVHGEDLLFPMGLVLQATREIKLHSPYPSKK